MTRSKLIVAAVHVVLFVAGLATAEVGLARIDLMPFAWVLRDKLLDYRAGGDRYDTVFVGSSRVHQGFLPAEFDQTSAELGAPHCSYNLGVAGRQPHDFDPVISWLLRHRGPALKRILVEANNFHHDLIDDRWMTWAEIDCFTPATLYPRIVTALQCGTHHGDTAGSIEWILANTALNALHIGKGPRIVDCLLAVWRTGALPVVEASSTRGFESLDPETAAAPRIRIHEGWIAERDQAIEHLRWKLDPKAAAAPGLRSDLMQQEIERCRTQGIELVYVFLPSYGVKRGKGAVAELAPEDRPIDLDIVAAHEDIFQFDNWFDSAHLLPKGAVLFSRRLAHILVQRDRERRVGWQPK